MPRNLEKNAFVRESRRQQILEAALSVYIRAGYYGTNMDDVAEAAKLAKGLVYYYYRTKKELFTELYTWMFREGFLFSDALLEASKDMDPVEQLMYYAYGMFGANKEKPLMMQFYMRAPFDAFAVFEPEKWEEGAVKSDIHRRSLADIIERGVRQGVIPHTNPSSAANSFWSVFVANVFEYSKLIMGEQGALENEADTFRAVVRFCFQGLGVEYDLWNCCLEKVIADNRKGEPTYEGL